MAEICIQGLPDSNFNTKRLALWESPWTQISANEDIFEHKKTALVCLRSVLSGVPSWL